MNKCGHSTDINMQLCVPAGESCPITDFKVQAASPTPTADWINAGTILGSDNLYYSTKTALPVGQSRIGEDKICMFTTKDEFDRTANRKYTMLEKART